MGRNGRGIGERSEIILNSIDIEIIKVLIEECKGGLGIMELKERIGIAHNSLKPHIERLIKMDFIEFEQVEKSRKILLRPTKAGKEVYQLITFKGKISDLKNLK